MEKKESQVLVVFTSGFYVDIKIGLERQKMELEIN